MDLAVDARLIFAHLCDAVTKTSERRRLIQIDLSTEIHSRRVVPSPPAHCIGAVVFSRRMARYVVS